MKGTARTDSRAASFATSRRGAPCHIEVRRLASQGRGVQTIANILGCCMEDVARILAPDPEAKNDNAPAPRPDAETARAARDETFRRMWRDGATRNAMARHFGMDIYSIDRKRARMGLPSRCRAPKQIEDRT